MFQGYSQVVSNSLRPLETSLDVEVVLDARSRGRWAGTEPEPRPNMKSGHIPHSLSLPFNSLLETNRLGEGDVIYTTLAEPSKLRDILHAALGDIYFTQVMEGSRSLVNSCGSGMTAAIVWLALRTFGIDSAIYDEVSSALSAAGDDLTTSEQSWSGYAVRQQSRIEIE